MFIVIEGIDGAGCETQGKNLIKLLKESNKNIRKVERKLEFKKYCNWCRAHRPHKQAKKT